MNFLAALSSGLEAFVGPAAAGMAYVAGKEMGRAVASDSPKTDDLLAAVEATRQVIRDHGLEWSFEPWKPVSSHSYIEPGETPGTVAMKLVFRDCMIRQSLLCYGHKQQQSLCYLMYGFFSGALQRIMGLSGARAVVLEILHSGPNACLKQLTVTVAGEKRP